MSSEVWLPLVTIGTDGMPMFTNGYQWFLPLAANLAADNLIINAPNDVIFKMTINENDEQIGAEIRIRFRIVTSNTSK